jgi:hypothetical protein
MFPLEPGAHFAAQQALVDIGRDIATVEPSVEPSDHTVSLRAFSPLSMPFDCR